MLVALVESVVAVFPSVAENERSYDVFGVGSRTTSGASSRLMASTGCQCEGHGHALHVAAKRKPVVRKLVGRIATIDEGRIYSQSLPKSVVLVFAESGGCRGGRLTSRLLGN